jgi:dihydroorotate dehydrogenase electron transfer subunit
MFKEIYSILKLYKRNNISAQFCFERMLGCGIGVCLGCVIKAIDGYRRICYDGPVFNMEEICW